MTVIGTPRSQGLRDVVCVLGDSQIHALREGSVNGPYKDRFSIQFVAPGRMLRCFIDNPMDDESTSVRGIFFRKILAWGGPIVASLGGGEHARTWSYNATTDWHLAAEDHHASTMVVTAGMLEAYFEYLFGSFIAFVSERAKATGVPGGVLSFPPVLADNTMLASMRNEVSKAQGFPATYRADSITPPAQRLETWRLVESAKRRLCEREGIDYIPAPVDAFHDDGFLAPQFVGDAFHANAAYGRLVLRDLAAWNWKWP